MKKIFSFVFAAVMMFTLCACGAEKPVEVKPAAAPKPPDESPEPMADWSRSGYFTDEDVNMLSITWMDFDTESGWYVGFMNGEDPVEDSYGAIIMPDGDKLKGSLASMGSKENISVVISEGEDGEIFLVENGEKTYKLHEFEMPEASISVSINVDGFGYADYAEGEVPPEMGEDNIFQSHVINLAEPGTFSLAAKPQNGNLFVKWTKNGEVFSTEPKITVVFDENAEYVAVFEEDADWQNPIMNFIGEYQCGRARAKIEAFGREDALVTIDWGGSATTLARWTMIGSFDESTMSVPYENGMKSILTYADNGDETEEVEYDDGMGVFTFRNDGAFVWHEDGADREDMIFQWLPVQEPDIAPVIDFTEQQAVPKDTEGADSEQKEGQNEEDFSQPEWETEPQEEDNSFVWDTLPEQADLSENIG